MINTSGSYKKVKGATLFLLLLCVFFGYELGNRAFANPDEGRYVEIPREMVANHDYVTPRLNGLKYFEKPPLFYWLQSAVVEVFGINETSMRFWSVFFAILGCLSVFLVCWYSKSYISGMISASVLATSLLYYAHSRLIILDMMLSVLVSGALWCFFLAFVKNDRGKNNIHNKTDINNISVCDRRYLIIMYVLSALACLTKGLIGVILPGIVIFLWIMFTDNWKKLREILYIPGIIIFCIIFLPWHIIVCYRNNDFFYFYFIYEHFIRYATTAHTRSQPIWYFIPIIIIGMFPWTGFCLVAIKNAVKSIIVYKRYQSSTNYSSDLSEKIFLLSWIFGILAFFSFSGSKLIPYILPVFPPIAYMTGSMISEMLHSVNNDFKSAFLVTVGMLFIAFIGVYVMRYKISLILQNQDITALIWALMFFLALSVIVLLCCVYFKLDLITTMVLYIFLSANMMWVVNKAAPFYQDMKRPSTKELAHIINLNKNDNDLVFCYKYYYQDFPIYLNSVVGVVDYIGELEFGKDADKNNQLLLTEGDFWKLWNNTTKRIFLLLLRKDYINIFSAKNIKHRILEFDKKFIVIINR